MTTLATPELRRGGSPDEVRQELYYAIAAHMARHERTQQEQIGPSEIGNPCGRAIGYKLLGVPECNTGNLPWKQTVGTATHEWLEKALHAENEATGVERYLIERTVTVGMVGGKPIDGHCDVYDRMTAGVIDWKVPGQSTIKKYREGDPGDQYKVQAHLYGRGWQLAGLPVDWVGVYFLPRDDELKNAVWWHETYNEQIAVDALKRLEGIQTAVDMLGNSAPVSLPTADHYCHRCPWFQMNSTTIETSCPGDANRKQPNRTPALTLA